MLSHPAAIKLLTAGRVVVINSNYRNVLSVVLNSSMGSNKERIFNCLVICEKNSNTKSDSTKGDNPELVQPVVNTNLFQPEGPCWHELTQVKAEDISVVTVKTIRIDPDKIVNDIKKRQQPRFK